MYIVQRLATKARHEEHKGRVQMLGMKGTKAWCEGHKVCAHRVHRLGTKAAKAGHKKHGVKGAKHTKAGREDCLSLPNISNGA